MVSARIGAGCPVEGKARPARCGVRLSCCLLSTITLLDLCIACFGVSCGQAARAPKQTSACRTSGHAAGAARLPTANDFKPTANRLKRVVLKMRKHTYPDQRASCRVATSEPGMVSARIAAGCPVEEKRDQQGAACACPCCLLALLHCSICVASGYAAAAARSTNTCQHLGTRCGQAARAPKQTHANCPAAGCPPPEQTSTCRTSGHATGRLPALPN